MANDDKGRLAKLLFRVGWTIVHASELFPEDVAGLRSGILKNRFLKAIRNVNGRPANPGWANHS